MTKRYIVSFQAYQISSLGDEEYCGWKKSYDHYMFFTKKQAVEEAALLRKSPDYYRDVFIAEEILG